eukprot:EG_transcript_1861
MAEAAPEESAPPPRVHPARLLAAQDAVRAQLARRPAPPPLTPYDRQIQALHCGAATAPAQHPLPAVQDTLAAYRAFLQALVPEDQLAPTERQMEAFLEGEAGDLERRLQASEEYALPTLRLQEQLEDRRSAMFAPAQAIVLRPDPSAERNTQLERAARLVSAILTVKVQADSGAPNSPCPPTLFGQTRLPAADEDSLGVFRSRHICVAHNNVWWAFDVYDDAGQPLPTRVLEDTLKALAGASPPWATPAVRTLLDEEGRLQLGALLAEPLEEGRVDRALRTPKTPATAEGSRGRRPVSRGPSRPQSANRAQCIRLATGTLLALAAGEDPSPPVGALTWLPRDEWAALHATLLESPTTRRSVQRLQSAILCLVLSPTEPAVDTAEALRAVAHDGGRDRWADTLLTVVVCRNGVAGLVGSALGAGHGPLPRLAAAAWERANADHSVAVDRQALLAAAELEHRRQAEAERRREEERSKEAERQRELEAEEALRRKASSKAQKSKAAVARPESDLPTRTSDAPSRVMGPSDTDNVPVTDWEGTAPAVPSDSQPAPYAALEWDLSPALRSHIRRAEERCGQLFGRWGMRRLEVPFGERQLRGLKALPVAFVHLAIQLAYYRLHAKACVVAQGVSVASAGGLWQYCPTVTARAQHFCRVYCGVTQHKSYPQAMHTLLLETVGEQSALLERFALGLQWPAHLAALGAASQQRAFAERLRRWLAQRRRSAECEMEGRREARAEARRQAEELERMEEGARDVTNTTPLRKGVVKKMDLPRKPEGLPGRDKESPCSPRGIPAPTRSPSSAPSAAADAPAPPLLAPPCPRATRQALGVVPHPLFQDELYGAVSQPLITLYDFEPSPAVASVILSPPAVEGGVAVACSIQAQAMVLQLSSAALTSDQLTVFTDTLSAVLQDLHRSCVVGGAPTSAAILPKENGQHQLAWKLAPAAPPPTPVVIAAFRR